MSHYLQQLVHRNLVGPSPGSVDAVRPRLPSLFEPLPDAPAASLFAANVSPTPDQNPSLEPDFPAAIAPNNQPPAAAIPPSTTTPPSAPSPLSPPPRSGSEWPADWPAPAPGMADPTAPWHPLQPPLEPPSQPGESPYPPHLHASARSRQPATPTLSEQPRNATPVSVSPSSVTLPVILPVTARSTPDPIAERSTAAIRPAMTAIDPVTAMLAAGSMMTARPTVSDPVAVHPSLPTVPIESSQAESAVLASRPTAATAIPAIRSMVRETIAPAPPAAPPTIQVSIGRIEVRATPAAPPAANTRAATPVMSLDEYLRQRGKGR